MSHEATSLPAEPALVSLAMSQPLLAAVTAETEAPLWTATRIDVARRMWSKGIAEAGILTALNRLAGAPHTDAQALTALARRLCWPRPQQRMPMLRLTTRDGFPSMAERQAMELAFANNVVELPLDDAVAWGRANGIIRGTEESEVALMERINKARAQWCIPQFRINRRLSALPPPPPPPAPPQARKALRRRRRA